MKTLTDTMNFSKYPEKTVQWVIDNDLYYFEWALDIVRWFEIDTETYQYYEDILAVIEPDFEDYSWHESYDIAMFGKND